MSEEIDDELELIERERKIKGTCNRHDCTICYPEVDLLDLETFDDEYD